MKQGPTPSISRRATLARLGVGAAVAAGAPIVRTVPLGAQTVASCDASTLSWNDEPIGAFTSVDVDGTEVSLSIDNSNTTLRPQNGTVQNGPQGGVSARYLRFDMVPGFEFAYQAVTLAFSPSVTNLTFMFLDIDNSQSQGGGWGDRVRILTGGFSKQVPSGSSVIGTGTTWQDPLRNSIANRNFSGTEGGGNVILTWPVEVAEVRFVYFNQTNVGAANQAIGIGDLTFQPCPPASAAGAGFRASAVPSAVFDPTRMPVADPATEPNAEIDPSAEPNADN